MAPACLPGLPAARQGRRPRLIEALRPAGLISALVTSPCYGQAVGPEELRDACFSRQFCLFVERERVSAVR